MFTGLIEEIGIIKEFSRNGNSALITVECSKILTSSLIGDSIAIDGVCQTITKISSNTFCAQISQETLNVTTFAQFKTGQKVNLERALTLSSRLGGHIVTGHIDGLAKVKSIQKQADFYNLKLEIDKILSKYIVKKGSIALNGISLTIADTISNEFSIAIIPHTFENTNLKYLKNGDFVNIEADILAKYVEKILSTNNNSVVNENFLKENGFF
jgi:riboflavin synthase